MSVGDITIFDQFFFKEQAMNIDNIDVEKLSDELVKKFAADGYTPKVIKKTNTYIVELEKNMGGANFFFGGQMSLTTSIKHEDNVLTVTYSNGAWFGKIIGIGFGVILCFVPTVMSVLGVIKQVKLYNTTRSFIDAYVGK